VRIDVIGDHGDFGTDKTVSFRSAIRSLVSISHTRARRKLRPAIEATTVTTHRNARN